MKNISNLIKEAKPLYFAKKRRNKQIKTTLCMVVCVGALSVFYPKNNVYYDYDFYDEIYLSEDSGFIDAMGLPTDEFGLLKVV